MTYIKTNDRRFYFGLNPRTVRYGTIFPIYGEKVEVIPEPFWYSFSLRPYVPIVLDQQNTSSCTGAATVGGLMTARKQCGFEFVELSIASIYGQINNGVDAGSTLSNALIAAHNVGACPISVIPHLEWDMKKWPPHWKECAKCYRVLEVYDCTTFEEMVSAILDGFVVCYGILMGRQHIVDVGSNGFLPLDTKNRKYGHAVLGVGIKRYNNLWWIETLSSWGEQWANGGFCYVPRPLIEEEMMDAWAIRTTTYCKTEK